MVSRSLVPRDVIYFQGGFQDSLGLDVWFCEPLLRNAKPHHRQSVWEAELEQPRKEVAQFVLLGVKAWEMEGPPPLPLLTGKWEVWSG